MSVPPKISDAEWLVMEQIWDRHPVSAGTLSRELGPSQQWTEATIKTMLGRLVKKGALNFQRDGKRYLYTPAIAREDCVRSVARGIKERIFGGQSSPMLAWFVRDTPLTDAQIEDLQKLLDAKRKQSAESDASTKKLPGRSQSSGGSVQ
jgi:BlaI family transcriptional regulator, penicillinase repressor